MTLSLRPTTLTSVCLALALSPLACTRAPDSTEAAESSESELSTLTMLYIGNERIWYPPWSMDAHQLVFSPLFVSSEDGEIEPLLLRDYEVSPDGRTWTYHLRSDIRWHDGVPFTAHDIAFTYDLMTHPEVLFWDPTAQTVKVADDSTFTITFHRQARPEPRESWSVYYPKHLLEDLDPTEIGRWKFWIEPVGYGPYRYVRHIPKTMTELEAVPDHFRGEPAIDRVVLRYGSANGRLELQSGNADVAAYGTIAPRDAYRLAKDDSRFRVYYFYGQHRSYNLVWNLRHSILGDRRVREALAYAIDRRAINRVLDYPDDAPTWDVPAAGPELTRRTLPPPLPFDAGRARVLLETAGWIDGDGDGLRERDGELLSFECIVDGTTERLAVLIREQLRQVGADLEILPLATPLMRRRLKDGEFVTAIDVGKYGTLLLDLQSAGAGEAPRRINFQGLRDDRLVRLSEALLEEFDPDGRDRLHDSFWATWQEDLPALVLAGYYVPTVAHRRVKGLRPSRVLAAVHMSELWIEEDE